MAIKSDAQRKAVAKYNATNYDKILLTVKKGHREELKAHAAARGESLNGFITRAITEALERDNGGDSAPAANTDSPKEIPQVEAKGGSRLTERTQSELVEVVKVTGESVQQYTVRAIESQIRHDKALIQYGRNPLNT